MSKRVMLEGDSLVCFRTRQGGIAVGRTNTWFAHAQRLCKHLLRMVDHVLLQLGQYLLG